MNENQGLFVVFEGIEGSSKSTQSQLFADWLKQHDINYEHLREPNGRIREILLDPSSHIHPFAELLLYAASRINTYKTITEPALNENKVVICDRYMESSMAHQGVGLGLGMDKVQQVHDIFLQDQRITLILDIPIEVSQQRLGSRGQALDRIEQRSEQYHASVREAYLKIAENNDNTYVIDASGTIQDIHNKVLKVLVPILKERGLHE